MTTPIFAAMLPKPSVVSSAACTQWLRSFLGVSGSVPYSPGSFCASKPASRAAMISAKNACIRTTVTRMTIVARQIPSTANGQRVAESPAATASN